MTENDISYIERIARAIEAVQPAKPHEEYNEYLYLMYALLALAKGVDTTSEDVHNAWAAWKAGLGEEHECLVPFDELPPEVQAKDDLYRDAIREVATIRAGGTSWVQPPHWPINTDSADERPCKW